MVEKFVECFFKCIFWNLIIANSIGKWWIIKKYQNHTDENQIKLKKKNWEEKKSKIIKKRKKLGSNGICMKTHGICPDYETVLLISVYSLLWMQTGTNC